MAQALPAVVEELSKGHEQIVGASTTAAALTHHWAGHEAKARAKLERLDDVVGSPEPPQGHEANNVVDRAR